MAHYTGSNETVRIEQITLQTPQSNLEASGVLGVNVGDPLTALRVDLTVRDLGRVQPVADDAGIWKATERREVRRFRWYCMGRWSSMERRVERFAIWI